MVWNGLLDRTLRICCLSTCLVDTSRRWEEEWAPHVDRTVTDLELYIQTFLCQLLSDLEELREVRIKVLLPSPPPPIRYQFAK